MSVGQAVILFCAALLGGTLNAVAGGGTFLTLPALLLTGVPPVQSNATSTIALWPGTLASAAAYRSSLTASRRTLLSFGLVSLVGGGLGALVLVHTNSSTFELLIPWLLLLATVLFSFGNQMTGRLRAQMGKASGPTWLAPAGSLLLQFVISAYGGFFGGGIGILMLATFAVMGMTNIHEMNALKTVLTACINGVAVVTFVLAGDIFWAQALVMVVGGIVGGYGGAIYARKIDPKYIRWFVMCVGFGMTIYFFVRTYA